MGNIGPNPTWCKACEPGFFLQNMNSARKATSNWTVEHILLQVNFERRNFRLHVFFKNCIWATEFFSMKPNWLLRFHGYHTFADYLNFHPTILAITKLCLFNYYNDTNLPWGIEPQPQRVLPTTTRECNKRVLHLYIAQPPEIPLPTFKQPSPMPKPNQQDSWHTQFYKLSRNLQNQKSNLQFNLISHCHLFP